jgi:hypothetical protein
MPDGAAARLVDHIDRLFKMFLWSNSKKRQYFSAYETGGIFS